MRWFSLVCIVGVVGLGAFPGSADAVQRHSDMRGVPNDKCLECHTICGSATGAKPVMPHPAHGIHLDVVTNCADCHTSVDLEKAADEPSISQVEPEICYRCHRGETSMVREILETSVSAGRTSERFLEALHTRARLPTQGDFVGSETCGDCHDDVFGFWKGGPHAKAMTSPIFERDWESDSQARACLRCHATGFDPATGGFALEGVGCEVCHGPMAEGHPDVPQGEPEFSAPLCANCHPDEWGEWRSSQHAEAGIECESCHNPHGQEILFPTVEDLCAACHEERGEVFAHSTHAEREYLCSECHMHPAEHGGKTGHTFSVGSGTCIRCHRDEIHARERIVTLDAQVQKLRESGETDLQYTIQEQQREIERLQTSRSLRLYVGLLQGSLIGLVVGGFGVWTAARRWGEEEENEDDEDKEEDSPSPDPA
jgi:predicted CXXCH cytochrome family protein